MAKAHIHILKMGGTIEFINPAYDNINKQLMKLDPSVDSYLENLIKPHFTYSIENVCKKDSRDIADEDRKKLAETIEVTPHENILITHGTFTLRDTTKFLDEYFSGKNETKKIILTGSMIPIIGFSASDAPFNLGYSIASFEGVKPGVYLCINGGIFKYNEVEKNSELLRFE
jgi:L-asparaginase